MDNIKAEIINSPEEYNRRRERATKEVGGDHYNMTISPATYIHANGLDFFEGNVIKYVSRHRKKNGAEDIKKAISYLNMILEYDYPNEQ